MTTKEVLARYLAASREALRWKCEGLPDYELRLPRTPTGTNLLGLLKHCAFVEHGYLVTCVGRSSDVEVPEFDWDADPNSDCYANADESAEGIDGAVGLGRTHPNMADDPGHLPAYLTQLTDLAKRSRR